MTFLKASQPELHSKLEVSVDYIGTLCLKTNNKNSQGLGQIVYFRSVILTPRRFKASLGYKVIPCV